MRPKLLAVEAEIKTRLSGVSSRMKNISATQPNISNKMEDKNASEYFFNDSSKSSSLISSVIFDSYVDTLSVFGFNSGKYYLKLIKTNLIPHLITDRSIQPTVIKKANQFMSFSFGDI